MDSQGLSKTGPRLRDRLATRVIVRVGLPLTAFLLVVIGLNARRNFANMRDGAERELRLLAASAAQLIEGRNNNAAAAARSLAASQSEGLFGDRRLVLRIMERMVRDDPTINGMFCVYEPDADGRDAESLETLRSAAMTDAGRFVPYVYHAEPGSIALQLEQNVNMETSQYYQGVKEAFAESGRTKTIVTEPYVYEGTGQMLVEFSEAIEIDGRFVGVGGVDVILDDLDRQLNDIAREAGVDALLVSSEGRFIALAIESSDDAERLRTRHVTETADGAVLERLRTQTRETSLVLEASEPDGPRSYFAAARIPTGNWLLVLRRSEAGVTSVAWAAIRRQLVLAVVALVVVFAALLITGLGVGRRVQRAAEAAGRIARGDLTDRVEPGRTRDETGYLLRAIRAMTEHLDALVSEVKRASIRLHSTSNRLAVTSHEQQSVVSSFGATTSQVAASTTEISATAEELARTMGEVDAAAGETASLASDGRASLRDMDTTMRLLDEATASIVQQLEAIATRAKDITGVVGTIIKVADQTNVLSVNAAIEAEKAGDAGAGFLVVAREIGRLADQTASATLDIEETVLQMQAAVAAGVKEMHQFAEHVQRTVRDVGAVAGQMEQIIERVDANARRFGQVSEGTRAQSEGAAQISLAMQDLTASAKRTSEATQEYGEAAEELRGAIETLKSAIASFRVTAGQRSGPR